MRRVTLHSEKDAIEAVRDAGAHGHMIEIAGAGTKSGFGRPLACDVVLDCSTLAGIVSHDPEELVITALAGTRITELDQVLSERNQRFGFDAADWGPLFGAPRDRATIGGVISADACGSGRVRFGAVRDHLLGFRAVNGLGESYKAGGRVVKNVTGFDLPKLMCGAMGTLGPLTEATLRVVPRPEHAMTLCLRGVACGEAFALLRRLWASPLEATGLAYLPASAAGRFAEIGDCGAGAALVRLEGSRDVVQEKRALARALCGRSFDDLDASLFRAVGNGAIFSGEALDVWRVFVPPAAAAACAEAIASPLWLADWAGALLWVGTASGDEAARARIRSSAAAAGGHATLLRADAATRAAVGPFAPEPPQRAALTRAVKAAFDPQGLFNPGRMFEGV